MTDNQLIVVKPQYRTAYKIVIAGLREHSDGTGRNRRTVVHAILTDDFASGRLKRTTGDLLCGADNGSFYVTEGEAGPVTCPKCKKLLERFSQ